MARMAEVIGSIERQAYNSVVGLKGDFSECMNAPEKYEPTEAEVDLLVKIKSIHDRGHSAEVKRSKDGFVVYDVTKEKR